MSSTCPVTREHVPLRFDVAAINQRGRIGARDIVADRDGAPPLEQHTDRRDVQPVLVLSTPGGTSCVGDRRLGLDPVP